MPRSSIKLIWSVSACNFCTRRDVRTCQVKPGKLIPKIIVALDLDETILTKSDAICTSCMGDLDRIVQFMGIRGAMRDHYLNKFLSPPPLPPEEKQTDNLSLALDEEVNGVSAFMYPPYERYNGHIGNLPNDMVTQGQIASQPSAANGSVDDEVVLSPRFTTPTPISIARPMPDDTADLQSIPSPASIQNPPTPNSACGGTGKRKERQTMYQCVLCEKIAGSKSHCMEHLICHSAVRPFACAHCQKTYKSRKACREHLLVMHNIEKSESQLYNHIVVDQEGLKQLEHVCTKYKKIYSSDGPKPGRSPIPFSSPPERNIKPEPGVKDILQPPIGSKSDWLYGNAMPLSTPPPPLLRCAPHLHSSPLNNGLQAESNSAPPLSPPAKRNRKGTPHKVVTEDALDNWQVRSEDAMRADLQYPQQLSEFSTDEGSIVIEHETSDSSSEVELNSEEDSATTTHDNGIFMESTNQSLSQQPEWPAFTAVPMKTEGGHDSTPVWLQSVMASKKGVPPCEICGRTFPTKEKMADHKRSHSEIKQFSCLKCNRYFKYRRGVTNHLKEVHRMKDRNEISSLVASHEIGRVAIRDSAGKKHWVTPSLAEGMESDSEPGQGSLPVSQRMIHDTISSLVDVNSSSQ